MIKSIPTTKVPNFIKRIKTLNRKQAEYGLQLTTAKRLDSYCEYYTELNGDTVRVEFVRFEVDNLNVIRDGRCMSYMGSRRLVDGIWIISVTDEKYTDEVNRECDVCTHCGKDRKRNSYYLFIDEDGNIERVGSRCKKEYFGIDVNAVLEYYEWVSEIKEPHEYNYEDFESTGVHGCRPENLFHYAKEITEDFTKYDKEETVYAIRGCMLRNTLSGTLTHELQEQYRETIKTVREYWLTQKSSYAVNVANVLGSDFVDYNDRLFVTGIFYGLKAMEKMNAEAIEYKECPYKTGDKVILDVTVQNVTSFETRYGISYAMNFISDDNVLYDTFTTGSVHKHSKGDRINIRATVGDDREYNGHIRKSLHRVTEVSCNK